MEFTIEKYYNLLISLQEQGFLFQRFDEFLENPNENVVILRHDVDLLPKCSLKLAQLENNLGISGSYYFRNVPQSFNVKIIKEIAALGHEIGYHYENLVACKGNYEKAIKDFENNLNRFRDIVPVSTICMHGSPMSKYDSRTLWNKYNYRDFGIIGEPYFDIDFSKVLYLTDTGRRWDGTKVSIRDKVVTNSTSELVNQFQNQFDFHSTDDIIKAANEKKLPDQIMITIHPQRWTNNPILWTKELIMQNIKNIVKSFVAKQNS